MSDRDYIPHEYLQRLADEGFYGTVELRQGAGAVLHVLEHRSLKPELLELLQSDKLRHRDGNKELMQASC